MHLETARCHQLTVLIHLERTVTGVGRGTVWQLHLEEALAFDCHVFAVVGLGQVTLAVQTLGRHRTNTGTDLQTGWQRGLFRRLRTRLTDGLIKQIFENRTLTLKTVGADVRQVVGDDVHIGLLCVEAGFRDP